MQRRDFLKRTSAAITLGSLPIGTGAATASIPDPLKTAASLGPLRCLAIAHNGQRIVERGFNGYRPSQSMNIKSASKSVISALVGMAIDRKLLSGPEQRIAPLLKDRLPRNRDARLDEVTIGHLLSMQSGLGSTSGPNYGTWVSSRNWVRAALARPFTDDPGGRMIYSTGSSHLLSAILARVGGKSTLALARDWFRAIPDFEITGWDRDPQGIYLGGNQMAMRVRSLLAFGELYRRRGLAPDGRRVLSERWIDVSWQTRTHSRWTGDAYGYGWFMRPIAGRNVSFGWGYGGQMIYIVPSLALTVAMTSDTTRSAARGGHRDDLHRLLGEIIRRVEGGWTIRS